MKIALSVLLISLSAFSQDYALDSVENEHYRSYTREDLVGRFGVTRELVPQYNCNGVNEHNPFWAPLRKNEAGTSLKIQTSSGELITYREGHLFKANGKKLRFFDDEFLSSAKAALSKIEDIEVGKTILRHLESSIYPLTITKGGNSFNPKEEGGRSYFGISMANALSILTVGRMTSQNIPFHDIGVGGLIQWNPQTKEIPPFIALGHEMYHAFDSIRGLLDMRSVNGEGYEYIFVSEYRAVWFENQLRKAAGLDYRTHYSAEAPAPGVLDSKGEPRKLPSPCL